MPTSQNGWRAAEGTAFLVRGEACGFGFWAANEDVKTVFIELIQRFNSEVEELEGPVLDDWSWASRPIRGETTGLSNHASATALDFNALKHVRGRSGTFTSAQRNAIDCIVDDLEVIRWGGDYVDPPVDEMHFEIHAGSVAVKTVAAKLRKRDEVTPDDVNAVVAGVMKALEAQKVIDNPATGGIAAGGAFSFASILENIETTQDAQGQTLKEILQAIKAK